MDEWHKLAAVTKQTGIPYQSLSRYIKRHAVHLQLKKEHKAYFLHQDSISTIQHIRKHYERGLTESQVEKELSMSGIPVVFETEDSGNELATLGKVLVEMKEALVSVNEKMEKQESFNQELLRKLENQQAYIEQLEAQKSPEASPKKSWQFWK